MKYLILLLCSLFTIQAQSEITVMQVSDYSVSSSEITDNNSLTVWGSSEGESVCTGSTACNSCAMNINKINSCNLKQIGPNINLIFTFKISDKPKGEFFVKSSDNNLLISDITLTNNNTYSVRLKWSEICNGLPTSDPSCMTNDHDVFTFGFKNEKNSNSGTLSVNIVNAPKITKPKCESNQIGANVGIYDFSVIPTNGMVFFPMPSEIDKNPMTLCSDRPKAKGGNIKSMVAFYNNEALSTVNSLSDSKEIILSGNYPYVSIINPYIQTPNNRTPTFVRLALKDKAGNIFGFTPHKEVADDCRNISKYSSIEDISKCQYSSFSL